MGQMDQRNEQLLAKLWETSGMKEWSSAGEQLTQSDKRLAVENAAELDPVSGPDPVAIQLFRDVMGVARPHFGEALTLAEASNKVATNDPAEMQIAFNAMKESPETYVHPNPPDDVRALIEKLLVIADGHNQRDIRIAAADCAGDLIGCLRYPTIFEPKD